MRIEKIMQKELEDLRYYLIICKNSEAPKEIIEQTEDLIELIEEDLEDII